jgi:dihydroxyacid dehydratase/phosphogluconate dehydratase
MAVEMDFAMVAMSNIKDRLQSRLMTEDPSRAPACQFDVVGIFKKASVAADLQRRGRDVAADIRQVADISLLMKTLLDDGHLRGDCVTALGRTIAEDLKSVRGSPRPDVAGRSPVGASARVAGMSTPKFARPVRRFEREAIDLLQDGDIIEIDAEAAGILNVKLTGATLTKQRTKWKARETNHRSGALWKFAQGVGPAEGGAVIHSGAHEKCYAEI